MSFCGSRAIDAFLNPSQDGRDYVAFASSMRGNMVRMLDAVGLAACLDINSTDDIFGPAASHLFCSTSLLRFPVFVGNKQINFSGTVAAINNDSFLRRMVDELFAPMLQDIHQPMLIVPMGKTVKHFCVQAAAHAPCAQVLSGSPHPSGGNRHRVRIFNENHQSLKAQIEAFKQRRLGASHAAPGP